MNNVEIAKKKRNRKRKQNQPVDSSKTVTKASCINGTGQKHQVSSTSTSGQIDWKANSTQERLKKRKRNKKAFSGAINKGNPSNSTTKTVVVYPKDQDKVSSNWKQLLQTLDSDKTKSTMDSPKSSQKRIQRTSLWNCNKVVRKGDEVDVDVHENSNGRMVSQKRKNANSGSGGQSLSKSPKINGNSSTNTNASESIWFDDVDPDLLEPTNSVELNKQSRSDKKENFLTKPGSFKGLTKAIGMDCEMVGVGDGVDSILARVSLVNQMGNCIYDKFVKPTEPVTDYRTEVSGVRPADLENAEDFSVVQKEVSDLLNGRLLVGHAVYNDLKVLFLGHPRHKIRDTSTYKPFRQLFNGNTPSLKRLAERLLGVKVQEGEHNSVQDAQATMRLYTMYKRQWETEIKHRSAMNKRKMTGKAGKSVPISPGTSKMSQLKI